MMKRMIASLLIFTQLAYAGRLQDADFKTEAELVAAGSSAAQLLNDSKVYITANGLNKKLSTAITDGDIGAASNPDNKLSNPGFEKGTTGWTASGGTFASTSTASEVFEGTKAVTWDSSAASQTLTGTAITVGGFSGQNAELTCNVRVPSGTATHTLGVWDGTTLSNAVTLRNTSGNTNYVATTINFIAPSSGTVTARFTSVASNEPSISIDDCYLGKARNIGTVQQARLIGTVKITGCASAWSTTSTTYATFATVASCSYAVTGEALAPTTNIPAIRFASLPPGEYKLEYEGAARSGVSGQDAFFQFFDGTNTAREESSIYTNTTNIVVPGINQSITYTSPQSNVTLQIRSKVSTGGQAFLYGIAANPGVIRVYHFPSSSQQAYNPSLENWKVDANISGANPSLGTASVSTYTGIENASLTLTNNTGSGNLTAQIPCSSTNAPTGTTCSVGNESVGVSFNLPKAGDVLACASFSQYASISQGATIESAFQIVETPNNAQTISQEGKTRTNGGNAAGTGGLQSVYPYRICGNFTFSSAGQKTLRLMYEQLITGSVVTNVINADSNASYGQRDIHWEVYPITQNVPAPVLVGSVTSNSNGAERIERVKVGTASCTTNPCNISSTSGGISSITRQSTGKYNLNFSSGFSSAPTCTCTSHDFGVQATFCSAPNNSVTPSTTQWGFETRNYLNSLVDTSFDIICIGPR